MLVGRDRHRVTDRIGEHALDSFEDLFGGEALFRSDCPGCDSALHGRPFCSSAAPAATETIPGVPHGKPSCLDERSFVVDVVQH
ncbi:hypothetical protein Rrhod_3509 [Rhodococcus rhodnii LMG 5362]|uniref:Uncharacterized protein n=1 Tax=Rhodococcus rhodnii LMG 5362 TaxID=1273125 RepID=R7WIV9_9NOCA|nr:hypothetical protein Rrhod_3509 [Rhodococcus rhodnii LMG 5362]